MSAQPTIHYTKTDEAPALATYSWLPVVQAYASKAGVQVVLCDISLAARILAVFADLLPASQRVADHLAELGAMTQSPTANIIKLPNISASVPQLQEAIAELQAHGYALPDYPAAPTTPEQQEIKARYDRVKGSAVNPVLREGNSDRRAPRAVKEYAKKHPHSMGAWQPGSRTRIASMAGDDFFANERSVTLSAATTMRIEFVDQAGSVRVLRDKVALQQGEVLDASKLGKQALLDCYQQQLDAARNEGLLFSLHLKATMMKVSDPVLFGHAVRTLCRSLIERHGPQLVELGVDFDNGLADLEQKLAKLPEEQQRRLRAELQAVLAAGPGIAMVDSDRGITNLHVPSDVIVDASIPAMVRAGGKMYDRAGKLQDTIAVIPDRCYAGVYQAVVDDCRQHGAFDPRSMGTVPNVGLMAQAAEEYGSHNKTFVAPAAGRMRVVDAAGQVLLQHEVAAGDIWRACQTKDGSIRDWVKLAVTRARLSGMPAVFWLDRERAHDAQLLAKVERYLAEHDTKGLDLRVMAPRQACEHTLARLRQGQDTIAVTGNVLRDYLTDLFPILEVGTSAKMLSIVPLMQGGGLFETGAGGSAPKHVDQFLQENYLRWDSLGEFFALAAAFEHLAQVSGHRPAKVLADTLDAATGRFLENDRSPGRKLGTIDNRGSHFYLSLYWAEALAAQSEDAALQAAFRPFAQRLQAAEPAIVAELLQVQGKPVDVGGYYQPDDQKAAVAMRPSATWNGLLSEFA